MRASATSFSSTGSVGAGDFPLRSRSFVAVTAGDPPGEAGDVSGGARHTGRDDGRRLPALQAGTYSFHRRLRASSVRCTVLASKYACTSLQR